MLLTLRLKAMDDDPLPIDEIRRDRPADRNDAAAVLADLRLERHIRILNDKMSERSELG